MGERTQHRGCHGCRHFRITHDPAWPYACAAFDLRAKRVPSVEVEAASGEPCRLRQDREPDRREHRPRGGLYA